MHLRTLRFAGPPDETTRTVPVVVSTDEPCDRGDFFEVLDHSPEAVDLSRAPLPLIESHDHKSLPIGIVEDLRVTGRQLRGVARFGTSARALEVFRDVQLKVIRGLSVGYSRIGRGKRIGKGQGKETLSFPFQPFEVSVVAIPMDANAGFFRSRNDPAARSFSSIANHLGYTMNTMQHISGHERQGDDDHPVTLSRGERRAAQFGAAQSTDAENTRSQTIAHIAQRHNMMEEGLRAIANGASVDQFRDLVMAKLERGNGGTVIDSPYALDLSARDVSRFSLTRLYRSMIERRPDLAPFEHECAREVGVRLERVGQSSRGGLRLPLDVMRAPIPGTMIREGALWAGDRVIGHRDLSTSTVGAGGAMVATDLLAASFIELLRARTMVFNLGATRLDGLVGNVQIPRQVGTVTINWVAQGGAATESDASFNTVTLQPRTAHGMQDVTRDLLLQGTPAVEAIVRADLLAAMAVTIDTAALAGTGASNQPTGLLATAGIGSVAGGVNGAAPTWDNMVQLEEQVANANSDVNAGSLAYITNARVRSRLKRTQRFTGTDGIPVFGAPLTGMAPGAYGSINDYSCGVSNLVPSNLTKGTSTGVCSAVVFGNWADLVVGQWGTPEILVDHYTQAATRTIRMHVYQTIDVAVRRPTAFAAMLDALTT